MKLSPERSQRLVTWLVLRFVIVATLAFLGWWHAVAFACGFALAETAFWNVRFELEELEERTHRMAAANVNLIKRCEELRFALDARVVKKRGVH